MRPRLIFLLAIIFFSSCGRTPKDRGQTTNEQHAAPDSTYVLPHDQIAAVDTVHARTWLLDLIRPLGPMRDSVYQAVRLEADKQKADTLLALFRARYSEKISDVDDSLADQESFQIWLQNDPAARGFVGSVLSPLGCTVFGSEGTLFIDANSEDITSNVGDRLSPAMVSFLTIRAHDQAAGFSDDAALLIPWDSLADRIGRWETFVANNPTFLLRPEAESWYDIYLRVYLTGMDNSRVFIDDADTLDPEVHASYERFVQRYPNSESAALVRGYLQVLKRDKFRHTEAADKYLSANHIRTMLAVQPPSR